MAYWAIDMNCVWNNKVKIESRRKVSVSDKDKLVLFKRHYDTVTFYSAGSARNSKIDSVESSFLYTCDIEELEQFENTIDLGVFRYSLEKVYRYKEPARHFRRRYLHLSESDYQTIVRGEIFWPRTAFGLFANKLDNEQLYRFVRELAMKSPDLLLGHNDINTAWDQLKSFIISEFVNAADLLTDIKHKVEQINSNGRINIPYNNIGIDFSRNLENAPNAKPVVALLAKQEKLLSDFKDSLQDDNVNLFDALDERMQTNYNGRDRFEKIFRGIRWPLQQI